MQMGGAAHQYMDTCPNPIVNKYREGVMKRTLEI